MKNLNLILIRLLQFVVFAVFTFFVLVYFGAFVLLPLDLVVLISKLFDLIGLGNLFGAVIGVAAVAYLGKIVYETSGLIPMIIDNGVELASIGRQRVEAFNKFAETAK